MEELRDELIKIFCDRKVHVAGLVELTESRNGETVLRKVGQTGNYTPVTYQGGVLAFFVINASIQVSSNRNFPIPLTLVLVTDKREDYKLIITGLDEYEYENMNVNLSSLDNYYNYFQRSENKPFTDNCFQFDLVVMENYKMCCSEYLSPTHPDKLCK
jgi:hypothetical protein